MFEALASLSDHEQQLTLIRTLAQRLCLFVQFALSADLLRD